VVIQQSEMSTHKHEVTRNF